MLGECGKPGVGHNCLLDLLYSMEQFLGPLPASFLQWRHLAAGHFQAGIFDTSHIAKLPRSAHHSSSTSSRAAPALAAAAAAAAEVMVAAHRLSVCAGASPLWPSLWVPLWVIVRGGRFERLFKGSSALEHVHTTLLKLAAEKGYPPVQHAEGFTLYSAGETYYQI
jgi:hypothetical protein